MRREPKRKVINEGDLAVAGEDTTRDRKPDIEIYEGEYIPWYKIGVNETIRRIKQVIKDNYQHSITIGTRKLPIIIHMEDPYFGRVLRILQGFKGINANSDMIGRFDEIIGGYYCRVKCIGGRIKNQELYKGENEL